MRNSKQPLVSICCLAYNHEAYIRECLDGFIMQQTSFPFEVLIHDDASTDDTAKIIKEYEEKYPDIIKPIYQKVNQYSKGIKISMTYNFPRVKGKYIALCEGDDYWTDPLKLQKQVDFLEGNKECSMVFSNAKVLITVDGDQSNAIRGLKEIDESRYYTGKEILENWTVPTASVLLRAKYIDRTYISISQNKNFLFGDIVLFLYMASKGEIYGDMDYMVVYRRHVTGATNFNLQEKFYVNHFIHLREIYKVFGNQLKTENHINTLADYSLSIGLLYLNKGNLFRGLKFILFSLKYNPYYFSKYVQNRFLKKVK